MCAGVLLPSRQFRFKEIVLHKSTKNDGNDANDEDDEAMLLRDHAVNENEDDDDDDF